MISRKRVLSALEHEEVDIIPYNACFGSMEATARFLGEKIMEANDLEKIIFLARLFNTDIVNVPIAGFPGSLGIFEEVSYEGSDHIIAKTPFIMAGLRTSGLLYWRKIPYFSLPLSSLVRCEEDLDKVEKPNMEKFKPKVELLAKKVQKLHELDYFVMTEIKGPMESPWMYLRGGIVDFLIDIVKNPEFAKHLIKLAFGTMMELTELVIDEAHVDAVRMTDDLGETRAPFISIDKYRALIKPWHKEAAKRIHKKGVKLCLHSHGNIMSLLWDMVETGPDSIDPLDPADGVELAEVKKKYGDKICIMGGITKNIGRISKEEIKEHILNVFRLAGPNGFIAMPSGGVPSEISLENFNYYTHILENARRFKLK